MNTIFGLVIILSVLALIIVVVKRNIIHPERGFGDDVHLETCAFSETPEQREVRLAENARDIARSEASIAREEYIYYTNKMDRARNWNEAKNVWNTRKNELDAQNQRKHDLFWYGPETELTRAMKQPALRHVIGVAKPGE